MSTSYFDRFSAGPKRSGSGHAENIQIEGKKRATLWPFGNRPYLLAATVLILLTAVMLAILLPLLLAHHTHHTAAQCQISNFTQCQTSNFTQDPGTHKNHTICVGSTQRSYLLFLPQNYDATPNNRSLILSYHGFSRTPLNQLNLDLLTTPYFNNDSIVVYPQGINETWQSAPNVTTDDILFTSTLLDHLSSTHRVDDSQIYATGKSQGAGFVGALACDPGMSQRIAAFAPVSGAFYTMVPASDCKPKTVEIICTPSRKVPFIEFHGGRDGTINYNGGPRNGACLPSIPHYITEWAVRDGLGTENQTSQLASDTVVYTFGDGLVRQYYDKSIDHDWPSTNLNADSREHGLGVASYNASTIIMDFFGSYKLSSG